MSALDRHPVAEVNERLRVLRGLGWKVVLSKHRTFWDITCKAGTMNTRIPNSMGPKAREDLFRFLERHERDHPGE